MALQTLNPTTISPTPLPPRQAAQPLFHLPPRRRLAAGERPRAVAVAGENGGLGFLHEAEGGRRWRVVGRKEADLATLGNLCVDVVLSVPSLPPAPREERKAYMERLAASPPDQKFWEAGGNCNLAFAAARLGLRCATLGHVGEEVYGKFLLDVLQAEGISVVGMLEKIDAGASRYAYETLLCWVLVDPFQRHGFCSRADFNEEPAFNWIRELPAETKMAIHHSKILFCNGYAFDEFFPNVITSAIDCAIDAGTAVFFDPGPRGKSLFHGTLEERRALEHSLRLSDVLLLTSDEAEALTDIRNPIWAGEELLKKGVRTKWVVIKMGSKGSIMITKSTVSCAPAFKVNIVDTVGCGDSFTAAIAFGFLHNLPAISTLTLANAVGAATATGNGAGRNVARLDKVLELLRESDLNEEDTSWSDLIERNSVCPEVSVLSRTSVNGFGDHLVYVPIRSVVSVLLPMFEAASERSTVQT